jgi:predicted oxidoreductase (fatty acid repression mutant protein)
MVRKIGRLSVAELEQIDLALLRSLIRERTHHTLEFPLYQSLYRGKKVSPRMGESVQALLDIYEARDPSSSHADLIWSKSLLTVVAQMKEGMPASIDAAPRQFSATEQETVKQLIKTRRSIRIWEDRRVPREIIEQVVEAGLWAPHACNLQTLRFIVLEGNEGRTLFQSGEITGWEVCIVAGQDMRPYEAHAASVPTYNQDLDCGAAVQNMLLMAHSLGLGAVWGTFVGSEDKQVQEKFNIPDYIRLRTYIGMGWPAQACLAPGRISCQEAILAWI